MEKVVDTQQEVPLMVYDDSTPSSTKRLKAPHASSPWKIDESMRGGARRERSDRAHKRR